MKYTEEMFTEDNYKFNILAGKDKLVSLQDLKEQLALVQEEVQEIADGLDSNNPVEVLDGLVDVYVVLDGLKQKLENLGFDIPEASYRVAGNNLTKFPISKENAEETKQMYLDKGMDVIVEYNPVFERWVVKDQQGKVRKPIGFKSVELDDLVPSEVRDGFKQRVLN